jgi:SAM-dependent methyltransferase
VSPVIHPATLQQALLKGLNAWVATSGQLIFSCQPEQLQAYLKQINAVFTALGKPFSPTELVQLCELLDLRLKQGSRSPQPVRLVVKYESAGSVQRGIKCDVLLVEASRMLQTKGALSLPCVPMLANYYLQQITHLLAALGQPLSEREQQNFRQGLTDELVKGISASPYSRLIVRYQPAVPPQKGIVCHLSLAVNTLEQHCQHLVATHQGPLFGPSADAKVMAIAALNDPAQTPILDIGAGTGRNTLPLARLGYSVDAIEIAPAFVEEIDAAAQRENLPVQVMQGNILDATLTLAPDRYRLAILSAVLPHFISTQQLRSLLEKLTAAMAPGGWLLFSLFLAVDGYEPDNLALQLSHVLDSFIFTRSQLASALLGLPLQFISDESAIAYERAHLGSWPPTDWFERWASGHRLFPLQQGDPPIELRWVLCQRF